MIDTLKKLGQNLTVLGQNMAKLWVLHGTDVDGYERLAEGRNIHETTVNIDLYQCLRANGEQVGEWRNRQTQGT